MRTIIRIAAAASMFSALCFAETWHGKLLDANCHETKPAPTTCAPAATTSAFGIETADGKFFMLDSEGNGKAMLAIKTDGSKNDATVTGALESNGKIVKVETLDVR